MTILLRSGGRARDKFVTIHGPLRHVPSIVTIVARYWTVHVESFVPSMGRELLQCCPETAIRNVASEQKRFNLRASPYRAHTRQEKS